MTTSPHHGGIWVENGWVKFRLLDEENDPIEGKMVRLAVTDPQELAQDMCEEYRVPIHGSEELDFQTIEP
jgi:hypothetical protein